MINKIFLVIVISLILSNCKNEKKNDKNIETIKTSELVDEKKDYEIKIITENENIDDKDERIDIEKELKIEFGAYIMRYKDSTLSFCNHEMLYNPLESYRDESVLSVLIDYKTTNKIFKDGKIIKYIKDDSFIEICNWKNEYTDIYETYFGKGFITDKNIEFPNGVQIGMKKRAFLSLFFICSEKMIKELKQISIGEDELGELYTKYKFKNDRLIEIEFGSQNENEFEINTNNSIDKEKDLG